MVQFDVSAASMAQAQALAAAMPETLVDGVMVQCLQVSLVCFLLCKMLPTCRAAGYELSEVQTIHMLHSIASM